MRRAPSTIALSTISPRGRLFRGPAFRSLLAFAALGFAAGAHANTDCASLRPQAPAAGNVLQTRPIAEELSAPNAQVGTGVGFAQLFAEGTTVELVLARVKHHECRATAAAAQSLQGAAGAYQPGAAGDAQAWRFNMTQNGKRMTADEFDAWMKARGVRVVQGPKPAEPPPPAPPAPAPEPPKKKKR